MCNILAALLSKGEKTNRNFRTNTIEWVGWTGEGENKGGGRLILRGLCAMHKIGVCMYAFRYVTVDACVGCA